MTTIAHRLSKLLPAPAVRRLRPAWHRLRDLGLFVIRKGGRLRYDPRLGCWVASRPLGNRRRLSVAVRSYRELRRFYQFGTSEGDVIYDWMRRIRDCEVLYDVGSANGLEGFFINHLHGGKIVFIEPFTPSVETILKTICVIQKAGGGGRGFEVVQAACDTEPSYQHLYMHEGPVPGSTANSFAYLEEYDRGGRQDREVAVSQWVPAVSLDSLHWEHGLPLPTHVKIDVDGFEDRVLAGARKLLESGSVRSWAIELNGEHNRAEISALMVDHGYQEVAAWEHYPGYEHYTGDHVFVRNDLVEAWRRDG